MSCTYVSSIEMERGDAIDTELKGIHKDGDDRALTGMSGTTKSEIFLK